MSSSISTDFVTSEGCQLGTSRLVYTAESTKGKVISGLQWELGFVDRQRSGSGSPAKEQRLPTCESSSFLECAQNYEPSGAGSYPSTWLLKSRNSLDDAFEKAWAAYTAVYNEEFKTQVSMKEVRERVMAGHIHGEDVLLPRPAVEHRLTRRRKQKE